MWNIGIDQWKKKNTLMNVWLKFIWCWLDCWTGAFFTSWKMLLIAKISGKFYRLRDLDSRLAFLQHMQNNFSEDFECRKLNTSQVFWRNSSKFFVFFLTPRRPIHLCGIIALLCVKWLKKLYTIFYLRIFMFLPVYKNTKC